STATPPDPRDPPLFRTHVREHPPRPGRHHARLAAPLRPPSAAQHHSRGGPRPPRGRPRSSLGLAVAGLGSRHLRRLLHPRASPVPERRLLTAARDNHAALRPPLSP